MTNPFHVPTHVQTSTGRHPDAHFWTRRPLGFTRRMHEHAYPHLDHASASSSAQRGLLSRLVSRIA